MTKLLIKLFIKDADNTANAAVRSRYGVLSGAVGIACNLLLTIAKFLIGSLTNSIAITADAVNNLSDAGSSAVTLFSFKAANRPADDEHPFGHGRIEYIAALGVAFLILMMGFELVRSSIDKIMHPEALSFSVPALIVLLLSIGVKIWMALFNHQLGKRIDSPAVGAVVMDSVSDTAATTVSMLALILSKFTSLPLDGYMGIIVALFIFYTGIQIVRDTVGNLLGQAPDPKLVKALETEILSFEGVVGVHDLIVHDYGPNRIFASAHAEVPSNADIMKSHDTIDLIEREIKKKFHMDMVIHMDPIVVNNEAINETKKEVVDMINEHFPGVTIHDFRMIQGPTHTNLIFDAVVPFQYGKTNEEVKQGIEKLISEKWDDYYAVIQAEQSYLE